MSYKMSAKLTLATFILSLVVPMLPQAAFAAHTDLTQASITFDNQTATVVSAGSPMTVYVKTPTDDAVTENEIRLTFPSTWAMSAASAYTVSTATLRALNGNSVTVMPGMTATAAEIVSTYSVDFAISALAADTLYAFKVTGAVTPDGTGADEIRVVTLSGSNVVGHATNVEVYTLSDTTFSVTAAVDPIFTLTAGDMAVTWAAELSSASANRSNGTSDTLQIATNANMGYEVLLKASNASGLASAKTGEILDRTGTVNDSPEAPTVGTEGYVIEVNKTTDSTTGDGNLTIDAEYLGNGSTTGGTPSSTYERVASSTGTTDGDTITFYAIATISAVTAAAEDYTDTWTIMAHGLF